MVELAGNGGIDQAALTQFERNFMMLAQQKQSKLEASGVVKYLATGRQIQYFAADGEN